MRGGNSCKDAQHNNNTQPQSQSTLLHRYTQHLTIVHRKDYQILNSEYCPPGGESECVTLVQTRDHHLLSFFMETLKLGENIPTKLREKLYNFLLRKNYIELAKIDFN